MAPLPFPRRRRAAPGAPLPAATLLQLPPQLQLLLLLLVLLHEARPAGAHGNLADPAPRGALNGPRAIRVVDPAVPPWAQDAKIFFPAGNKSAVARAGVDSQAWAGGYRWEPFRPLRPDFRWRAGVCGDTLRGRQHHLVGGRYAWPPRSEGGPRLVATLRPGGLLDARLRVLAHHNGFIEFHLCDVTKCPGRDISAECFRRGHCVQLRRAPNRRCDSGASRRCGPVDRRFPGRWYLPCSRPRSDSQWETFGPGTILYRIPKWFRSEHAVLHWYWGAASKCNPDGVLGYFDGPDRPWGWGKCGGQANAVGGVARGIPHCGGPRFPEDYYNCADVAVRSAPPPTWKKPAAPHKPAGTAKPPTWKKPAAPSKPAGAAKPPTWKKPAAPSKPAGGAKPPTWKKPAAPSKPAGAAKPPTWKKPAAPSKPAGAAKPPTWKKPAAPHKPTGEAKPPTWKKPAAPSKPAGAAKPPTWKKPAAPSKPAGGAKPPTWKKPAAPHKPTGGAKAPIWKKPAAPSKPAGGAKPPTWKKPVGGTKPPAPKKPAGWKPPAPPSGAGKKRRPPVAAAPGGAKKKPAAPARPAPKAWRPPPKRWQHPQLIKRRRGPWQAARDTPFRALYAVSLGRRVGRLNSGDVIVGAALPDLTFEVEARGWVRSVTFTIKAPSRGARQWTSLAPFRPFRMFAAGGGPNYWRDVVYDEWLTVMVATPQTWKMYFIKIVRE